MKKNIECPVNRCVTLVLDSSEVFADDPGEGTPALVIVRHGSSEFVATYDCVMGEGEVEGYEISDSVYRWLEEMESEVEACIEAGLTKAA